MTASTLSQSNMAFGTPSATKKRSASPLPAIAGKPPTQTVVAASAQGTEKMSARPSEKPSAEAGAQRRPVSDIAVCLLIAALTWAAWGITRLGWYKSGDDVGYWLGVAGGVMMLLLLTYPVRKHLGFARRWGKVSWWLVGHMLLGVGGPLFILLHSNFEIRSLNAAAAFYSMVIVALSGVVGRFIYTRINRGMHGERSSFKELQQRAGLDQTQTRSKLTFAPAVEARLRSFGEHEHSVRPGFITCLRRIFWLPVAQWRAYRACVADLREPLEAMAVQMGLDSREEARRSRLARKLVRRYLQTVVRVAQYTAYERLFSLWHVAHLPFVFLLAITAVVHVVAVHAY
jgi:hypothetical protein